MHPQLRQIPPSSSRSTMAVLSPSCAARIAATDPPGPEPRTMRSYWSAILLFLCGDLPRLAGFVEGNEGEFALGNRGFKVAVALAGDRFRFQPKRSAPVLQQLDIDAEFVADRHRARELDRIGSDQDRLAVGPPRGERAAGEAHLPHQPPAEHAAIRVGVGRHRGDADHRLSAQASIPSGFSTRRLNACISLAPSAPSIARWSKLPVALIMVAIWSESLIT